MNLLLLMTNIKYLEKGETGLSESAFENKKYYIFIKLLSYEVTMILAIPHVGFA